MRNKPCLTTDDVQRVVAAAKKHAAKLKREPTIAVVDEGGHLLYLEGRRAAPPRFEGARAVRSESGCGSGPSS
jgi:glc operon protein GlcG